MNRLILKWLNGTAVEHRPAGDKNLFVIKERCPQNHQCPSVAVCPVNALTQSGFDAPQVDADACVKCGKCVGFCPKGALVYR